MTLAPARAAGAAPRPDAATEPAAGGGAASPPERRRPRLIATDPVPAEPGRPSRPMAAVDAAWLRMDEPENLMLIHGVLVFDGPVTAEEIRRVVAERLLTIPRFRHRIVRGTDGGHAWEEVAEPDLARHVVVHALPGAAGEAELRQAVGRWLGEPLDPSLPPWQFLVVERYGDGESALVGRLHHAIGDGIALMLVLLSLADLSRGPDGGVCDPADNPFAALFDRARRDLEAVRRATEEVMPEGMKLLLNPAQALRQAGRMLRAAGVTDALGRLTLRGRDPRTVFKGPLGVEKRVAWSEAVPLAEVRRIAQGVGATVTDVLSTAAAGALRRYLLAHGEPPARLSFRAAVPVNLRPLGEMTDLGNRFGLVFLGLPVGIADPRERLAELRRRMQALKRSAEPLVVFRILQVLGRSPLWVQKAVVKILATKTTAVLTSVPGPARPLYLAGRRIRDFFFWVPQAGRVGLGISILSYDGRVRLGVATDAGLVPDPQRIVEGFHAELAAMAELAPDEAVDL